MFKYIVILFSLSISSDAMVIDYLASVYKKEPTPTKFFSLENKKEELYLKTIISELDFSKDRDIIIIYDGFIDGNHGKTMLSIINDTTKQNIILFDDEKGKLLNQDLKIISRENINFELFLSLIAKMYPNQKIIVSMSTYIVYAYAESVEESNVMNILYYNLNLVKLIQNLNNVYLNKSFGNPDTRDLKKYLSSILKNKQDQYDFINSIEDDIDNVIWRSESEKLDENKRVKIIKEITKYEEHDSKDIDNFIKAYMQYKRDMRYKYLDSYALMASLRYMKSLYPNYNFYERISIVKSITPAEFRLNVIDAYNNNIKLPEGLMTYTINLHKSLNINNTSNIESFVKFQEYANKYEREYPFLFRGIYDVGMGYKTTEYMSTRFHYFSINSKEQQYGTSVSTALKTYVDQLD